MSFQTLRVWAACALVAACGPAPVPIEPNRPAPASPTQQHSADDGHDHGDAESGAMPNDDTHAGMQDPRRQAPAAAAHEPQSGGEPYAGTVRLRGALAEVQESYLFISVMPEGQRMPGCFDRLDLGDAGVGTITEDERVISFSFASCPIPAGNVELKVQWDEDGYVESDDKHVAQRYPVARGAQDIDVVLEEAGE